MYFGCCVRVLVVSLLTLGHYANALGYRSGGSSGIKPLFDYSRNHKLVFASDFESSAQPGGFLGNYGSSHSEGGQVDRYSPEGSVSSYGSGSLNIRKPTQNSRQPPQTNPNANGVIQAKADMGDLVLPQNGKRFDLGTASSKGIIMLAGHQPHHQPAYQPSVYQPKPQHPGYQPKPQQPGYQPQQGGVQGKPPIWEFFSPIRGMSGPNVQPANLKVPMTVPIRRQNPMASPHRPWWQQSLVPVYN